MNLISNFKKQLEQAAKQVGVELQVIIRNEEDPMTLNRNWELILIGNFNGEIKKLKLKADLTLRSKVLYTVEDYHLKLITSWMEKLKESNYLPMPNERRISN